MHLRVDRKEATIRYQNLLEEKKSNMGWVEKYDRSTQSACVDAWKVGGEKLDTRFVRDLIG